MPNHVQNILSIIEHDDSTTTVQDVVDFMTLQDDTEDKNVSYMDFNKLIPMPESLYITNSSYAKIAYDILKRFGADVENFHEKIHKPRTVALLQIENWFDNDEEAAKAYDLGVQYLNNKHKHGHTTWYDWAIENWETKWNAYKTEVNGNEISFQTAWSPVINLMTLLAERFPDLSFKYDWADEDTGYNVGQCKFDKGQCGVCYVPVGGTKEAYELSFKIRPDMAQRYKLEDNNYVYDEDSE